MNKFDRSNLKNLRADLQKVLDAYGADTLAFELGNISFTQTEANIKLTAKIKGAATRRDLNLERMVAAYKLVTEKNGKKLVGYEIKNRKYPFIYEQDGKRFKTTTERAQYLFAA